jgi:hypothetical protein
MCNESGVPVLVSGRVVPRGDSIEVSAELTDVRDNTEIWGQHYSGKSADIISLQQQIAGDLAEKLRSNLSTSERQQLTKQGTQNLEAAGWKGALTKGIETRQAQRKTGYSSAYRIAVLHADLGDKDQTFRWLNAAYQERDLGLLGLKTDFLLDPLRSDPRFAELVRKVLPQ